ncbi:MAG: hypothetical protein AAF662_16455 [Pseudomonadota bacterium]
MVGRFTEEISRAVGALLAFACLVIVAAAVWAWMTTDDLTYLLLGLFGIPLFTAGWGRLFPGEPPPIDVSPDEPLLLEAAERARASLDTFRQGVENLQLEAYAKVRLENVEDGKEHLWAVVHRLDIESVVVALISEPVYPLANPSARYRVGIESLSDWMLIDEQGNIQGAFSESALAKLYQQKMGYVPTVIRQRLSDIKNSYDEGAL